MTLPPMIPALMLLALVSSTLCWRRLQTIRAESILSSADDSGPLLPDAVPVLVWGCLLVTVTLVVVCSAPLLPVWLAAPTVLAHVTLSKLIVDLSKTFLKRSAVARYMENMNVPRIAQARFALYFSEPRLLTPYQVTMWLDPLLSLNEPFVILLNERKHLKHFPKSDLFEVLVVSDLPATFPFLPPKTEVLFYVNNSMVNLNVIKANPDVTHVQLLHGDSDKPPSFNPMSVAYDHLFVAGKMAVDRYKSNGVHIPPDKFRIVGRPQLKAAEETAAKSDRKTIVYMTTWSGMFEDSNFCSLPQAHDILRHTFAAGIKADVIFKPHPVSYRDPGWADVRAKIEAVSQSLPDDVTFRMAAHDKDPLALYEKADVLISDVSSTVIDFLFTGKPYIVTNPRNFSDADLAAYPSVTGGGLATEDASNIPALLGECLGADPLRQRRVALRKYAFGDYGRPQGDAFREACRELLSKGEDPSVTGSGEEAPIVKVA